MFKGNNEINQIYKGDTLISKVYKGDTLIYPSGVQPNVFEDATVAYSLMDLGLGATHVVRVRRSSDNAEQDFTANQILQPATTTGSLRHFCGAGNGFVSIWYDQKGLYNATQSIASLQPRIVNNGSLILENGKPSISFNNSVFNLPVVIVTGTMHRSFFFVNNQQTSGGLGTGCLLSINNNVSTNGGAYRICKEDAQLRLRVEGSSGFSYGDKTPLEYQITTNIWNGGGAQDALFWINGVDIPYTIGTSGNLNTVDNGVTRIGLYDASASYFDGTMQEIIIYNQDKSAERTQIENDINNRYAIY